MFVFITVNVFAGVGDVVVSNEFPANKLMLANHVYKNAAVFENMGVYSGNLYAIAQYVDAPSYCAPGYYLPENSAECVICDENHYCIGGENPIMESCPEGLVSPAGTAVAENCGKLMRVGEDMLYLTQVQQTHPALAVRFDGNTYYAKTTPISSGEKPMNINTSISLHAMIDGTEYSIHDNTISEE